MGNFFSDLFNIKGATNPDSEHHQLRMNCRCGGSATYRCSVKVEHEYLEKFYVDYPFMKQYWHGTLCGSPDEYSFIACEDCIGENQNIFTHYPDGWGENPKFAYHYEKANLI
ncbi:hypothetical protein [Acanthamoeba castellanii mimivirus]|uniref:Uncharacterized protein L672 n=6 Tax=Mimivirus TaxID=315393 RepID=YL672_MIMIV|nr:hypothetical protein MIMI_gp0723 [Acanthamoeba polyphaga mimivirus]Q5UNT2.1 RecName: Full=Uncharacterized protein L672 [Acanthamoeba polyphaga mimivirus]AEQ60877.1 hypothetical protein [Acanthamoeba castellanii mamavirus]AHA45167.1 hypothetical protein HIRU_S261 [Hirudovirus strain Sangsue]ALR84262.1 hypothetical protein [Niemeyer virus]AMZ03115.1 hypothetical protein [Mimivirus Bombay]EJN41084.1 hypothetical protein lvs_L581 [Acanthamoeba polyphaga lentillevirus]QTF49604.1 hypothetical p